MFLQHLIRMMMAPSLCLCCQKFIPEPKMLCSSCLQSIRPIAPMLLRITPSKQMTIIAVSAYQEPLKSLIMAKHSSHAGAAAYAGQLLAQEMIRSCIPVDFIVPVPLHWTRYAYRGFNQAHLMAQKVSEQIHRPVVRMVRRTRLTKLQLFLSKEERYHNVRSSMQLAAHTPLHMRKHILIVDDLMTTGSTLQEVARALAPLRPASLTALVLCRTI